MTCREQNTVPRVSVNLADVQAFDRAPFSAAAKLADGQMRIVGVPGKKLLQVSFEIWD